MNFTPQSAKKGKKKMFNSLKKLIKAHFYATAEIATSKVDTVFAMGKITEGQYIELTMLIEQEYGEVSEE